MKSLWTKLASLTTVLALCSCTQGAKSEAPAHPGLYQITVEGKTGFINKAGKVVIAPQYNTVGTFAEGLATVSTSGSYGFIDKTGKLVIPQQFEQAGPFSEGLAVAKAGGKWGVIDKTGKFVVEPQFDQAFGFSEGLSPAAVGSKWGFVDKTGKFAINPQYDVVTAFEGGLAHVKLGREFGYIDQKGSWVWKEELKEDPAEAMMKHMDMIVILLKEHKADCDRAIKAVVDYVKKNEASLKSLKSQIQEMEKTLSPEGRKKYERQMKKRAEGMMKDMMAVMMEFSQKCPAKIQELGEAMRFMGR